MKKVAFYTLGCKLNFSETSTISRAFESRGYEKVNFSANPDVFIINTCSVTDNADKKCRKIVREARSISPNAFVAIIGCYAQLKPDEIAAIHGVDAVLGASEKFKLLDLIESFERPEKTIVLSSDISEAMEFNPSYSINDRTRTFLKVQDGCNYGCSFCTIPLARGKSRSATIKEVLKSAMEIAHSNTREIVITGINTGDFGVINGRREERFVDLLKALDKLKGIGRIRISSIEPNLLSPEIIEFIAQSKLFVPHFHIPLQSGSDQVLKRMNRRYQTSLYKNRIEQIKSSMPTACIGADVIVGFPGETEAEFLETINFIKDLDISYLHVFPFSERINTTAALMTDVIPTKVRIQRSKILRGLSEKKKHFFYEENVSSIRRVLFENDISNGKMHGFTENYIRVEADYDPKHINEIKSVKLRRVNKSGLMEVA